MGYTLNYNGIPQMTPSLERILKQVAIDGQTNGLLKSGRVLKRYNPVKDNYTQISTPEMRAPSRSHWPDPAA